MLNVDVSYPMLTEGVISNMNIDVKEVEVETALKSMTLLKLQVLMVLILYSFKLNGNRLVEMLLILCERCLRILV